MIRPLRHRHQVLWRILVIALPVLFTASVINSPNVLLIPENSDEPPVFRKLENNQLSISISAPLRSAFTEVFVRSGLNCENHVFIGKIESVGDYRFDLPKSAEPCEAYLYDHLNQRVLFTSELK